MRSGCETLFVILFVRVKRAVGVKVATLRCLIGAGQHQLERARLDDFVAILDATQDLDPLAVLAAEVCDHADDLVRVLRITAKEHPVEAVG